MDYKIKVEKVEYINGFKVINRVPDITEEERELIKQEILQKLYKDFSEKVRESNAINKTDDGRE